MHDAMMKPIVLPKYDIGLVVKNCNVELLRALEPWCSSIHHDIDDIKNYIEEEQPHTEYNLSNKILSINVDVSNDIEIRFDGSQVTNNNINFISQMPMILQEHNEVGSFAHDIFEVTINTLEHKTKELIKSKPLKSYGFKL
jgi:hypothetical protein